MQVTGGSHNQLPVKEESRAARNSQSQRVSLQRFIVVPDGLGRRLLGG